MYPLRTTLKTSWTNHIFSESAWVDSTKSKDKTMCTNSIMRKFSSRQLLSNISLVLFHGLSKTHFLSGEVILQAVLFPRGVHCKTSWSSMHYNCSHTELAQHAAMHTTPMHRLSNQQVGNQHVGNQQVSNQQVSNQQPQHQTKTTKWWKRRNGCNHDVQEYFRLIRPERKKGDAVWYKSSQ